MVVIGHLLCKLIGFSLVMQNNLACSMSFDMENHGDGTVSLKSCHRKYITATKVSLPEGGHGAFVV